MFTFHYSVEEPNVMVGGAAMCTRSHWPCRCHAGTDPMHLEEKARTDMQTVHRDRPHAHVHHQAGLDRCVECIHQECHKVRSDAAHAHPTTDCPEHHRAGPNPCYLSKRQARRHHHAGAYPLLSLDERSTMASSCRVQPPAISRREKHDGRRRQHRAGSSPLHLWREARCNCSSGWMITQLMTPV
jgi:hypothetical protein